MKCKKNQRYFLKEGPLPDEPRNSPAYTFPSNHSRQYMVKKRLQLAWITTVIALLLCVGVLLIAISGSITAEMAHFPARMAGWLTNLEFMTYFSETEASREDENQDHVDVLEGTLLPNYQDSGVSNDQKPDVSDSEGTSNLPMTWETLYQFDYAAVPKGETPILPMDLSLSKFGNTYINNATGLKPDVEALLAKEWESSLSPIYLSTKDEPLVLVLHTHGTEGYSEEGESSFLDTGGEIARSENIENNVVAVGKLLSDSLNEAGITTLHCVLMHDQMQYKDSYARSEQTIQRYLKAYPSIRLVIDLHRDSILRADGELVRPVTLVEDQPMAQVMCVVGSNWNGADHPNWERNLSLALKLRVALNEKNARLCRPVYLKSSTYNQELAPYSLLLEIGASGNSLNEAKRAVLCVAEALKEIIPKL